MGDFVSTSLSIQTLGILYGGLTVSSLYLHKGPTDIQEYEIMGIMSVMIWTLSIIHLCKFVSFALTASGNGEGSETFTLYCLLLQRRNCKSFSAILVLLVMFGMSFLICIGILSPTLSVISIWSGASTRAPWINEYCTILGAFSLVLLFTVPQCVTMKKKNVLCVCILGSWLSSIAAIGVYNIVQWNPRVLYAFSPHYICYFFRITGLAGLCSLLGVILCIPGAVSMFVDVGHSTRFSLRRYFFGPFYGSLA